ncbi:MAG: hypothetical protein AAF957_16445 [Planctomycetota bacterium]
MRSLLLSVLAPLTLSSTGVASPLTGSFVPQDGEKPGVVPAPLTAEDVEGQIDPLDGEILGKPIHGERIPKEHISPGRIESMTLVLQREAEADLPTENPRTRNGRPGEWQTPNPKTKFFPHSGEKCVLNRWGDLSMGLGFGELVDVDEVWVAAQGGDGGWAEALRVVGFLQGQEVGATEWFTDIDREPSLLTIGLTGVDRIVVEARSSATGAGFYSLDDLAFTPSGQEQVVVDFEDANWDARLTGSSYAGLAWEIGGNVFDDPRPRIVPAPQTAKDAKAPTTVGGPGGSTSSMSRGGSGTLPTFLREFLGPRFGDAGANFVPPDTCGAVGVDYFVAAVNSNLSVYDKVTQARVLNTSLQSFWGANVGDPRIAYDYSNDRWVAIATPFDNRIFIAYSLTNDPTGAWFKASFNAAQGSDSGRWVDYPTLGVDSRGIFIGAFMVGNPARMTIFAIDKAPLLSSSPTLGTVTAFRSLAFNGAIQHAVQVDDPGVSYMISTRTSGTLRLRTISPPMTNPTLQTNTINGAGSYSNPLDAPALGSTVNIDTGDTRLMNAMFINGSIWTAHCVNSFGRAAAKWYEVDPVAQTVLQTGLTNDPSLSYYYPSIAADADGNVVMGFSGSDATIFPSAYFTGRIGSDPAGQMAPPVLYSAGAGPYTITDGVGRNRWGDYSVTSLDPVDGSFWTIQERTRAQANRWTTRICQVEHDTCGRITRYCTPVANPSGLPASIDTAGSTSLAANDLQLAAFSLPGQTFGLFFFGANQAQAPVGDGNLCIDNPFFRLPPVQSTLFGVAIFDFDNQTLPSGYPVFMPGDRWNFSFWYRQMSPAGFNFADALEIEFCD